MLAIGLGVAIIVGDARDARALRRRPATISHDGAARSRSARHGPLGSRSGRRRSARGATGGRARCAQPLPAPHVRVHRSPRGCRRAERATFSTIWRTVARGRRNASQRRACPRSSSRRRRDRRFAADAWREQPFFSLLRQSYLLYADLPARARARSRRCPSQRSAGSSSRRGSTSMPSRLPISPPRTPTSCARRWRPRARASCRGCAISRSDAQKGRITMTDEGAFDVGRNLAVTRGSVVFRNELIELIQYDATTPKVVQAAARHRAAVHQQVLHPRSHARRTRSSRTPSRRAIRCSSCRGATCRRSSARSRGTTTSSRACITALRVAREITGSKTVNALGFCVGGTLLACALAVLAARKQSLVASATFLTTMLDFADPGDIGVYVSRAIARGAGAAVHVGRARSRQRACERLREPACRTSSCGTTSSATT